MGGLEVVCDIYGRTTKKKILFEGSGRGILRDEHDVQDSGSGRFRAAVLARENGLLGGRPDHACFTV